MANIMDYLNWRGDLSFAVSPFNEVDNFILSQVVSLDFGGIVPESGGSVPLAEAVEKYTAVCAERECRLGVLMPKQTVPLTQRLPETARFGDMRLTGCASHVDAGRTEQFAAVTFRLSDGSSYVAFRGTDDTIAGWKEDFLMAVEESVPAQRRALAYLEWVAREVPGPIRVGGHSKGGNLSVFAAMHASDAVKERILAVYNNDGPGFPAPVLETAEYRSIRSRVVTILPQFSLVGTMLTQEENSIIVKSNEMGPLAHDGFCWEVLGAQFVRCGGLSRSSRAFDEALEELLSSMDMAQRRQFVEELFDALTSTGAETLTDLTEGKLVQALEVTKKLRHGPAVSQFLSEVLRRMAREYVNSARDELKQELSAPVKRLRRRK